MYININTVQKKPAVSVASKEGGAGVNAEKVWCIVGCQPACCMKLQEKN